MKKIYKTDEKVLILSDNKGLTNYDLFLFSGLEEKDIISIEQYNFYDAALNNFREYENSIYEIHLR